MTGLKVFFLGLCLSTAAYLFLPQAHAQDVTLDQCRDQLLSGSFVVTDARKDFSPLNHLPRGLAKAVQDAMDRKVSKDVGRSEGRFDRLYGEIMRKVLDRRWAIDETSQTILDDCYFAVHPDDAYTD